ncbi:MAG: hypothetical protein AAB434_06980 [Planctomycetota bacterium]
MGRPTCLSVAFLALLLSSCRSAPTTPASIPQAPAQGEIADPRAAVARLGDPSWAARERAMADLLTLGASALPSIQEASASTDAEVRWRAKWLLSAIPAPVTDVVRTGPLERSETWRGVVRLRGTVSVPTGLSLTIDSGCRVLAEGVEGCRLVVEGTLVAHGTVAAPIDLGPEGPGAWEGLHVRGEGASASLRHARVRSARIGVYCLRGRLVLEECSFADSTWGAYLNAPSGGVVRGCSFTNVQTPIGLASPCPGVVFDGNLAGR